MTSISIDPGWIPVELPDITAVSPDNPWYDAMTSIPRHLFAPRWWERDGDGWTLRDGPALAAERPGAWSVAFDTDHEVVTRVGQLHADDAAPGDHPDGQPTEESAAPGSLISLFEDADVQPGCTVLLADAASGYECALLARQLGPASVTALASPEAATRIRPRLAELGLEPTLVPRPAGPYDTVISAVPGPVPTDCLAILPPGGRLAAHLPAGIVVATKFPDGTARGHVLLWGDDADGIPNPFDSQEMPAAPVTVQPDGTLALRLGFPGR